MQDKEIITKCKLMLGKIDYNNTGKKDHKAVIEFELLEGENGPVFSARAEIWNSRETDIERSGVDEIIAMFPNNKRAQRIKEIWKEYHLNNLQVGTPEQQAEICKREEELCSKYPECYYDEKIKKINSYALAHKLGFSNVYDMRISLLKQAGLYMVPLSDDMQCTGSFPKDVIKGKRGYVYGERWLYKSIPEDIIEEIKQLSESNE